MCVVAVVVAAGLACSPAPRTANPALIADPTSGEPKIGDDVYQALSALPQAEIAGVGAGGVPSFIRGQLSRVQPRSSGLVASDLAPSLAKVSPVFRLAAQDLALESIETDELGQTHARYLQRKNGLEVVGGELILHLDSTGAVFAANGSARDGVDLPASATVAEEAAVTVARQARVVADQWVGSPRLVYLLASSDRAMHLAYEIEIRGEENRLPVRDRVYVDARTGAVVDVHPQIETALNRVVYSANNGTSLPGGLKRAERQAANSDAQVNFAYDNTGATYEAYQALFHRDSYDNAGATLISSVHYDKNYDNAYWDGTQMVYGDGDGTEMGPLAVALDVTAHELTHAVTERTSNLTYSNESGAINESMSDCIGETVESWQRGNGNVLAGVTADTWKVGESMWTPGTPGDALRYLDDPTADGYSVDYYPERTTGSYDYGGVHANSGISNLAFYLLSQGGHHPRNKTPVTVTGIGLDKAAQIFYRANTRYLTPNAQFADLRAAAAQAATDLYGPAEVASVEAAFDAVGVPGGSGSGGVGSSTVALTNGLSVDKLSATTGEKLGFSLAVPAGASNLRLAIRGGMGDADLYLKFGSAPTTRSYDCRPYVAGNNESCTVAAPGAGTWYAMLNAYASFAGVTITGSYTTGSTQNDFSISLSSSSVSITPGSSQTLTVSSGGAQPVSLSVSGLPSGVTGSFSPASVAAGGSSILTLSASSTAAATSSTFTVKATSSGASHTASGTVTVSLGGGGNVISNGVALTGLSAATGADLAFTMVVPSGATGLTFAISGGRGDADLYVKFGSAPTLGSYDCRPYVSGNNETCTFSTAQAGTYYVMLHGYAAFSGVSLLGQF